MVACQEINIQQGVKYSEYSQNTIPLEDNVKEFFTDETDTGISDLDLKDIKSSNMPPPN